MKLFKREKAPSRSFEEITAIKGDNEEKASAESADEALKSEGESVAEEKSTESAPKSPKQSRPFGTGEFNAFNCFGWKEDKTEVWLQKCAKGWYLAMSFVWFVFGALTFAPIIFMSNKVDALFNDRKKSLVCGIAIYVVVVALIVLLFVIRGGADASQVVDVETMTEAITTETTEIVKMR